MGPISQLFASFGLKTSDFTAGVRDIQRETKEIEKSVKPLKELALDVGKGMTAALTVPLAGIATAAGAAAIKMDSAMDDIRAGTGATGAALEGLGVSLNNILGNVPSSIDDIATAITDVSRRTGLVGKPLEDLATQELNLARLTKTSVAESVALTTRVFGDWGIATDKQSGALDYLFKVGQKTGVGVNQLAQSVVQFGAPLRQMGFDFETSAALIGKFEKEGVNAELVMGSLRIALTKLSKAGVQDAAQGLELIQKRIEEAGSTGKANAIAVAAFGAKAGPDMAAAIREGRFALGDLVKDLKASGETINKASDDTKSFTDKLVELQGAATKALAPIGAQLVGALERMLPVATSALGVVGDLAEFFSKLPTPIQDVVIAAGAFTAALGPAVYILGSYSSAIVKTYGYLTELPGGVAKASSAVVKLGGTVVETTTALTGISGVTGTLATGGLVALAASVGTVIGMFANWILKVTGLQESFDKLLAASINTVPVIGPWITGANQISQATADNRKAQDQLVESLKKRGIAVDQARLNDSAYIAGLQKMLLAQNGAAAASAAHAAATGKAGKAAVDASGDLAALNKMLAGTEKGAKGAKDATVEFAAKVTDAMNQMSGATKGSAEDTRIFYTALANLDKAGKLNSDTLLRLKPQLEDYRGSTNALVQEKLKEVDALGFAAFAFKNEASAIKEAKEATEAHLKATFDLTNKVFPIPEPAGAVPRSNGDLATKQTVDMFKKLSDMKGVPLEVSKSIDQLRRGNEALGESAKTDKEIIASMSGEIQEAARVSKALGIPLDANTKRLMRQIDAQKAAEAETQQWKQVWTTAVGNITSQFADGVTNMIFEGGKFSMNLKNIFKELGSSIVKILVTDAFTKIGKGLSDLIFGNGGGQGGEGGGGGGLLGGLSTIGSAIGGLFKRGPGAGGGGGGGGYDTEGNPIASTAGAAGGLLGKLFGGGGGGGAAASQVMSGMMGRMNMAGAILGMANDAVTLYNNTIGKIGQGRRAADAFIDAQNAFGNALSALVDPLNQKRAEGTATRADVSTTQELVEKLITDFNQRANTFAAIDATHAKVINQAFGTLEPLITKIRSELAGELNAMGPDTAAAAGEGNYGDFSAAVTDFRTAVDQFVAAAPAAGGAVAVSLAFDVGGIAVDASTDARTIRDVVVAALTTNQDEFTTRVATLLKQAFPGIVTVPAS